MTHVIATRAQQLARPESYTQEEFSSLTQAPYMTRKAETKPFAQMQPIKPTPVMTDLAEPVTGLKTPLDK